MIANLILFWFFISAVDTGGVFRDITENFWEKLKAFYDLLRLYDYIIMILESEHATLRQVAASWAIVKGDY